MAIASPDEATMIRADAPGSLLRPTYLQEARAALASGELTMAAFRRIEDQAVDEAIALQEDAGLDVVTDGEMRRADFMAPSTKLSTVPSGTREGRSPGLTSSQATA